MSTIVLFLPVSQVVVSQGRAAATATVTNTTDQPARVILRAFPPPVTESGQDRPIAADWTTVDRPLREIGGGATEQFTITFAPPEATAAGSYPVRFIAYSADGAPEENSDQSRQVDVVVPAGPVVTPPPPRTPWWIYAVAAALLVLVAIVAFLLLRGDGPPPTPSPTPTATPSTPAAPIDEITWNLSEFDEGGAATPVLAGTTVTLRVEGDQVSGSAGCNVYRGSWVRTGDEITVGALSTTLRLCSPTAINEQERRFLNSLRDARTVESDGTTMALVTAEGGRLVFGR